MDYLTLKLLESGDPRGRLAAEKWCLTMSQEEKDRLVSIVTEPPISWLTDPEMSKALKSLRILLKELGELS